MNGLAAFRIGFGAGGATAIDLAAMSGEGG